MCENIFGSKTKICEFKQFIFFLGKKIVVSFLKRKMLSTMMRKNLFWSVMKNGMQNQVFLS